VKSISKLVRKLMGFVPALAMALAVASVVAPCHFFLYQPNVPDDLKKYGR
jgi:cyclic lactone autoinducer peptide